jgi:hypothetical protein
MNYELKDKINVSTDFLNELEARGWQEIEHLQAQIANLADGPTNDKLRQLFKNLLTSYYVFTGGIETLSSEPIDYTKIQIEEPAISVEQEPIIDIPNSTDDSKTEDNYEVSDPFEYFVDFDEPVGEPISDEDLYSN